MMSKQNSTSRLSASTMLSGGEQSHEICLLLYSQEYEEGMLKLIPSELTVASSGKDSAYACTDTVRSSSYCTPPAAPNAPQKRFLLSNRPSNDQNIQRMIPVNASADPSLIRSQSHTYQLVHGCVSCASTQQRRCGSYAEWRWVRKQIVTHVLLRLCFCIHLRVYLLTPTRCNRSPPCGVPGPSPPGPRPQSH